MTFSYDGTKPNPPDDPSDDVSQMQTNAASISSIVATDHVGFNVAGGGQHKQITFNANNVPASPTSPPVLFTNTANALPELFFYSGTAAQSANQYTVGGSGSVLGFAGIIQKWMSVSVSGAGGTFTFAAAGLNNFPSNAFMAFLSPGSTGFTLATSALTTSQITIGKSPSAGTVAVSVLIIGN